jgi:hypothetical protein
MTTAGPSAGLADAESGEVVDLLPDREAGTLEAWLKAHPGAEVICRDRAGAYAEGAAAGHPPRSRSPTAGTCCTTWANRSRKRSSRTAAASPALQTSQRPRARTSHPASGRHKTARPPPPAEPDGLRDVCGRERTLVSRTRDCHAAVPELLQAGQSAGGRPHPGAEQEHREPVRPRARCRQAAGQGHQPGNQAGSVQARTSTAGGTRASPAPPPCTPN